IDTGRPVALVSGYLILTFRGEFMKTSTITRILLRDILREDQQEEQPAGPLCFGCSQPYSERKLVPGSDDSSRFCSVHCRQDYDPDLAANYGGKTQPHWYSMPLGRHGFLIKCAGCGKRFDSMGLRCCSTECERTYRERQEINRLLAQVPFRAAKRKCK